MTREREYDFQQQLATDEVVRLAAPNGTSNAFEQALHHSLHLVRGTTVGATTFTIHVVGATAWPTAQNVDMTVTRLTRNCQGVGRVSRPNGVLVCQVGARIRCIV